MKKQRTGRSPQEFSREFSRKLTGLISESENAPTGQQIARALSRNDGYVSERKNGKRSWTVDDLDVIAELIGTTGLELMAAVGERMSPGRPPLKIVRPEADDYTLAALEDGDIEDEQESYNEP